MNKTNNCPDLESVKWTETGNLISLAILAFINVLVIGGNCLVIAAVFLSHKLRSVTNFFIVNLAVADLLVGLAVLPFSATWEVFKVWIFGDLWCRIWLAVDVWMCTASILNLCAISLDRFIAVTRPVTYPSIMSTARAKILVTAVWVVSFVICCPPLVGLITQPQSTSSNISEEDFIYYKENHTLISVTTPVPPFKCKWTCELTNHAGYVVYSAVGSFYVPMLIMLFFYYRIYRAAVRTTRAINQGFKTTRGMIGNRFDEQRLTLRIHRGRGSKNQNHLQHPQNPSLNVPNELSNGSTTTTTFGSSSPERFSQFSPRKHDKIKISVSYPSTENLTSPTIPKPNNVLYAVHYSSNGKELTSSEIFQNKSGYLQVVKSMPNLDKNITQQQQQQQQQQQPSKKMGKRNIKTQVKRFRMETKAAKTLGIIVGLFILCWLPFFTMYLIRGFCDNCIEPLVFSIIFWLGYCNSAVNPMIYALFSKDFRFAFKKIICKCCFCSGSGFKSGPASRRGSDMSQIRSTGGGGRTPSLSPSVAANSLGDDSDQMSECR